MLQAGNYRVKELVNLMLLYGFVWLMTDNVLPKCSSSLVDGNAFVVLASPLCFRFLCFSSLLCACFLCSFLCAFVLSFLHPSLEILLAKLHGARGNKGTVLREDDRNKLVAYFNSSLLFQTI